MRTVPRIVRLDLAQVSLPEWHPEASSGPTVPVYGFVIDHPDGAIVVDTGVGFGNDFIDEAFEPERQRLDAALRAALIDPDSVVAVVNSHLHFDHCGQNPMLYGSAVPFYLQRPEVEAVGADPFYTDASWALPPDEQRRVIDGDHEIADGVTILATPGHTNGHQSVLVEGADERVVIAGQAVWHSREFEDETASQANLGSPDLRDAAIDSIRRLRSLRASTVHFSHCAALTRRRAEPESP